MRLEKRGSRALLILALLQFVIVAHAVLGKDNSITVQGKPVVLDVLSETQQGASLPFLVGLDGTYYGLILPSVEVQHQFYESARAELVEVQGILVAPAQLHVTSVQVITPATLDYHHTLGDQRTVVLLAQFNGNTNMPQLPSFFSNLVFDNSLSVKRFWEQNSYNLMRVVKGGAFNLGSFGWFTLPFSAQQYVQQNPNIFAVLLTIAFDALGSDPSRFGIQDGDRVLVFLNDNLPLQLSGGWSLRDLYLPINGRMISLSWITPFGYMGADNVRLASAGYGSNLGFSASGSSMTATDSPWDVMSRGCTPQGSQTHASNKINAQWLAYQTGFRSVPLMNQGPLVIPLYPTTDTVSRVRGVIVGGPQFYYSIEYRKRTGFDSCLPGEGMILHRFESSAPEPDRGVLIDATPGDNNLNNAQFIPGQIFVDAQRNVGVKYNAQRADGGIDVLIAPTLSTASLGITGTPRVGSQVQFTLSDPMSANIPYVFAMAFSTMPPIVLPDGRTVPLTIDPLLMITLAMPSNAGLVSSSGMMDSSGAAFVAWNIPNRPALRGLSLVAAYITYLQSGGVVSISRPSYITIV